MMGMCRAVPLSRTCVCSACSERQTSLTLRLVQLDHSASSAAVASTWRGALVVIAYDAEEGLSKPALDVDTGALRPLMEYLRLRKEYVGPVFVEQPQERWSEGELKKVLDGKGE